MKLWKWRFGVKGIIVVCALATLVAGAGYRWLATDDRSGAVARSRPGTCTEWVDRQNLKLTSKQIGYLQVGEAGWVPPYHYVIAVDTRMSDLNSGKMGLALIRRWEPVYADWETRSYELPSLLEKRQDGTVLRVFMPTAIEWTVIQHRELLLVAEHNTSQLKVIEIRGERAPSCLWE